MQTHNRNNFTTIHTEGALLPVDLLQRISENDKNLEGLNPESYHLAPGEKLNEAINRSWNRLSGLWGTFQAARGRLGSTDPLGGGSAGTTLTRERWLLPLFQELGFGRLSTSKAVEIEGKSYPISHRWQNVPLHLVGCGIELDKRTPGAAGASRTSPHSLMQEYLNRSDDVQWGVISNGLGLRILRDNATLTRQAYIEFDLESMFDGEIYSDFVLLWLMCHQSRFETVEKSTEKQAECLLEKWSKSAQESGTRALDDLRRGVEEAIVSFGQGFLQHPMNGELRNRLKNGDLAAQDYYRQLLRLVYRLIFLFAAEDRDLLLLPGAPVEARQRFQNYYSTTRLRALAQKQRGSRHHDRYEALRLVMTLLGSESGCQELAIPALGGFLFDARSTADLNDAKLDNQAFLSAVRSLAFITEENTRQAVDYRNLGPEELGSVYESLLELHPLLNTDAGTFQLTSAAGNERKTTGSYYTPSSLIQVLLDSALDPVIQDRLKGKQDAVQQEQALLDLKVCDPACGSGHFLIAAAHHIAGKLAEVRAGDNEPSPNENRRALRDVIRHCIFGVDINPMAVELCKVNLWLESLETGKPLSFLDAHIQCGDSLVGVGPGVDISVIPDDAFNPAFGDDKATSLALKRRNKAERAGQMGLDIFFIDSEVDLKDWMVRQSQSLDELPEETVEQVGKKEQSYKEYLNSTEYCRRKLENDIWTAAFFWIMESQPKAAGILAPTQEMLRRHRTGGTLPAKLIRLVEDLASCLNFFHWKLAFPKVFAGDNPGFDCVLGNPPWERLSIEDKEFFSEEAPEIASAKTSERKKLIEGIRTTNPDLFKRYVMQRFFQDTQNKFLVNSNMYSLSAKGRLNTYLLFLEKKWQLISRRGLLGVILQSGLATDDPCATMFRAIVEKKALIKLLDFENRKGIFPAVHRQFNFDLVVMCKQNYLQQIDFAFYIQSIEELKDDERHFSLSANEFLLLNPNTKTCPVLRSQKEAKILLNLHKRIPILVPENEIEKSRADFLIMFISETGSEFFRTEKQLMDAGYKLIDNTFCGKEVYKPLYEAKLLHQFDHAFATYESDGNVRDILEIEKKQVENIMPRTKYWVPERLVEETLARKNWKHNWLLGYRDVTNPTNERTAISAIIPRTGAVQPLNLIIPKTLNDAILILTASNSFVCDYVVRRKISGRHLNITTFRQLPIPSLENLKIIQPDNEEAYEWLLKKTIELVYTSSVLREFAEDFGYFGPVFKFNKLRRSQLRAEIDGFMAHIYGVSREEFSYILDTFTTLRARDESLHNSYRTKDLCLQVFDHLEKFRLV